MAPLGEQMPGDRNDPLVPSRYAAPVPATGDFPPSIGLETGLSAAPPPTRGTLLGQVAVSFDVLDRALKSALEEIENMGGDLAIWLEESDAAAWTAAGAVVLVAGGGFYWQRRRGAQRPDANLEEDLSCWFLTHLCVPAGRS